MSYNISGDKLQFYQLVFGKEVRCPFSFFDLVPLAF